MDPAELAALTQAITEKVLAKIVSNGPTWIPGAVQTFSPETGLVEVKVDGDPPGQYTPVQSVMGANLVQGERVIVLFVPPHGAFVVGRVAGTGDAATIPAGWSAANVTQIRTLDANTAQIADVREVLGTLILALLGAHILAP